MYRKPRTTPPYKTGRTVIYIILLFATIGLMWSLRQCTKDDTPNDSFIQSEGDTIDVAIQYAPLSLYHYNDTLGGFNYDMLRDISRQHGLSLKFHPVTSVALALDRIDNGQIDILVAEIPATVERKGSYRFLEPVDIDRQVLVQLKDSASGQPAVRTQLDLAGLTVWTSGGKSIETRIASLSREIGDTIYVITDSTYASEQLFMLVAIGEIPMAVVSERIARSMSKDYPSVDISTPVTFSQFQGWIAGADNSVLADSLDRWIKDYKSSPAYERLRSRYHLK